MDDFNIQRTTQFCNGTTRHVTELGIKANGYQIDILNTDIEKLNDKLVQYKKLLDVIDAKSRANKFHMLSLMFIMIIMFICICIFVIIKD
jgi:hypothetical protein